MTMMSVAAASQPARPQSLARAVRPLAIVMVVALFALCHPYAGLLGDSTIYAVRALADLDPAGLGRDPMVVLDGQMHFSLFPSLYRPLVAAFGASRAAMLASMLGSAALARRARRAGAQAGAPAPRVGDGRCRGRAARRLRGSQVSLRHRRNFGCSAPLRGGRNHGRPRGAARRALAARSSGPRARAAGPPDHGGSGRRRRRARALGPIAAPVSPCRARDGRSSGRCGARRRPRGRAVPHSPRHASRSRMARCAADTQPVSLSDALDERLVLPPVRPDGHDRRRGSPGAAGPAPPAGRRLGRRRVRPRRRCRSNGLAFALGHPSPDVARRMAGRRPRRLRADLLYDGPFGPTARAAASCSPRCSSHGSSR